MRIMLICEAVFPENKGGLERWMAWFAKTLWNRGHEVIYLNASGVSEVREGVLFVSVTEKSWKYIADGKRSISQSLSFANNIWKPVRDLRPDVIYSVQAPIFSIFSLHFLKKHTKLIIVEWIEIWSLRYWTQYLGILQGLIGFTLQFLATRLGHIRTVFSKRCLNQLGSNNADNLLLPGLHLQPLDFKSAPRANRIDICFIGRFVAEKQPILTIQVAIELKKLGWEGNLNIIGTGPMADSIRTEIKLNQASNFIQVFENASQEKLHESLSNSFMLIHPSKREGYGLVVIEAAERLVPTLLIDYPENASVDLQISPEYVSSSDDPRELALMVLRCYRNQELDQTRLQMWQKYELPKMSASKSVDKLLTEINLRLTNCQEEA